MRANLRRPASPSSLLHPGTGGVLLLLWVLLFFPLRGGAFSLTEDFDFLGTTVAASLPDVSERLERELLLMSHDTAQLELWLKRGGAYFPDFDRALAEAGVPFELRYLAVIESSLLPRASSGAGAGGLWQFMKSRGRSYGLRIDRDVDERLHVVRATRAAAEHLRDLREALGDWHLAVAAYNLGDNGVKNRMERQGERDYWGMIFPAETERYLPRLIVANELLGSPEKYGLELPAADLYRGRPREDVTINVPHGVIFLKDLKAAAGCSFRELGTLNPWIRGTTLPAGSWILSVPPGSAEAVRQAAEQSSTLTTHVVKRGESLSAIGQKYHCTVAELMHWNQLRGKQTIHPGQSLIIYR